MSEHSPGDPANRPAIRAGDAERERVVSALYRAMTEGQLDYAEFDERSQVARRAKFRSELEPLTVDLAVPSEDSLDGSPSYPLAPPVLPAPSAAHQMMTHEPGGNRFSLALMSGTELSGDWQIAPSHTSCAVMGGTYLDLSTALLSSERTSINVAAIMGGIEIAVPEDVRVTASGLPLMGGFSVTDGEGVTVRRSELPADAPTVTVRGVALMGGVSVVRVPRTTGGAPPPHQIRK